MLTYKALKELAASLGHSLSPTGGPQYRLPDMIRAQRSRLPYLVLPAEDVVNAIRWNLAWGSELAHQSFAAAARACPRTGPRYSRVGRLSGPSPHLFRQNHQSTAFKNRTRWGKFGA